MSVLADWLVRQAPAWLAGRHGPLPPAHRRALTAILRCRTPELGGRVYRCTDCTRHDYAYHSCHHRACPRCGGEGAVEWTEAVQEKLPPVPCFFWTFCGRCRPLCGHPRQPPSASLRATRSA